MRLSQYILTRIQQSLARCQYGDQLLSNEQLEKFEDQTYPPEICHFPSKGVWTLQPTKGASPQRIPDAATLASLQKSANFLMVTSRDCERFYIGAASDEIVTNAMSRLNTVVKAQVSSFQLQRLV
jgi:hypothetical protein